MPTAISDFANAGHEVGEISVSISYDIIRLFSEGLYKSPHKAIEELVCNSYDAGAKHVYVLLPDPDRGDAPLSRLWVIDDGHGMTADGFHQLWRVADSAKTRTGTLDGRLPIGQFGIGKLAAYVLAWHLVHLSRVEGRFLLTVMNFRTVTRRQTDNPKPETVSLREVDEKTAKSLLSDVEERDPLAWRLLFGADNRERSWTAAGLSDFRDLYGRLSEGRLRWVLSTGLPLHSDFEIHLNQTRIASSKTEQTPIKAFTFDEKLPGVGLIKGEARVYKTPLTGGKSSQIGRSHGFFIRVRDRVINLEDELFGIAQPNHAAWVRFALEAEAEGLRDHLLSSREGVKDVPSVRDLRQFLLSRFNKCRSAYDEWRKIDSKEIDIQILLSDEPSGHIIDPLLRGVRTTVDSGEDSFYIAAPKGERNLDAPAWLDHFRDQIARRPFEDPTFGRYGPHATAVQYDPSTRRLKVNLEHPFVDKLTNDGKNRNPAKLFAPSEVLLEGLLQDHGIEIAAIAEVLHQRDRILRLMAGEEPPTATEAIRLLEIANQNEHTLERATGAAFRVLGFDYERRGGNRPGTDGVLFARLGRHGDAARDHRDYKLVYDAKHTGKSSVAADRIDPSSLEYFRSQELAAYGFFIAAKYAAEENPEGKVNRKMFGDAPGDSYEKVTLLKIGHLDRLIRLHCHHGLTLTDIWNMFDRCRTVRDVDNWIDKTKRDLSESEIPVAILVQALEDLKTDLKAVPNIKVARVKTPGLEEFSPSRLIARLKAVETLLGIRWLEVNDAGDVQMHQTSDQILAELDRQIGTVDQSVGISEIGSD